MSLLINNTELELGVSDNDALAFGMLGAVGVKGKR